MKSVLFLAFICFLATSSFAQDSILVWNEKMPLSWSDFNGQGKDSTDFDAEVFAEVRFEYNFYDTTDYSFNVFAIINKNTSWSKRHKQSDELLKHEQLHFDIAELYARKLKEAFENYHYTSNYAFEISEIFASLKSEYHRVQQRCDLETNHSVNKVKQSEWEQQVSQELATANTRLYELIAKQNK